MNRWILLATSLLSSLALAQTTYNVTFRCGSGDIFQVRSLGQDQVQVQRGLYQPVNGLTRMTLTQVISASGSKYSNGDYTVWIKGAQAMLLQGETALASDCTASRDSEPLTPVRDASSGIVFVPPERWLAQDVKLTAQAGSDIDPAIQYEGNTATHQLEYHFQTENGTSARLLNLLVFPASQRPVGQLPANTLLLGTDGQRTYFAQLAGDHPFEPGSAAAQQFAALRLSSEELTQSFSMYGVVINQAVETVSVNVHWLDRALRPGSEQVLELRNLDSSKAGEVVARHSQILEKGTPKAVVLRFDPAAINPKHRYLVSAKLRQNGRTIMSSEARPVLTHGHGRTATLILN
ncbi:YbaY family lipoprotein [Chitinibacter sp. FCG-7]|uniref:YbaY family lipoprotein n=1 Tax=Chitinibacter mangrovi TaxID=3153927 RepID=A0AAU7F5E2_9NEIS